MEIYLLENKSKTWEAFDAVVVVANDEDDARTIHPSKSVTHIKNNKWMETEIDSHESEAGEEYSWMWVSVSDVHKLVVTHIGKANEDQKRGVVFSSFINA